MKRLLFLICMALSVSGLYGQRYGGDLFSVGDGTFLLDGAPFVIKAAEIHYTRVPPEYWEHRIQMCKALGMNTICLVVFWNIHEQVPGQFDFTGGNDIARFCQIAADNDMWVILRPGSYICAEWEMGGFPWWLLKKDDIQLRSLDPYFMERTRIYMNEVGKQVAGMTVSKGGNIIMVQVENEFGAYGTDKQYVSAIRDIIKEAGFDDVLLFQCDWNSNFENNALDDLYWTVNFGSGSDINSQFERLRELRPQDPMMCSEFWSGWFDHWGRKHETRSAEALVSGLEQMLDQDISFSLYMTHGGTTFGHWGGANSPPYSAMCSSYDYDAPISEAGHTTEKFYAVRELLARYKGDNQELCPIPQQIPVIEIEEFELTAVAPLFENLPQPVFTGDIHPMEHFDQGYGSILYRTSLNFDGTGKETLLITDVHDWAQVFLDGRLVETLYRRRNENTVKLPAFEKGAVLDILVEAMGRVNFDQALHDRKGITEKVEVVRGGRTEKVMDWQVYSFPVDYGFVSAMDYSPGKAVQGPAFYRGEFLVKSTGDTFIDMSGWGKGLVWVNGKALGRFWKIGPQQTLYMPGCWLREGVNEIIVMDIMGPEKPSVAGLSSPILDMLRTDPSALNRRGGQGLDLSDEEPVSQGEFDAGNGWQQITFDRTVNARYFCLESLSTHEGDGFATIAELEILGPDGQPVPRQNWTVVYADSEETNAANNSAEKTFDLQESTYWHTEWWFEKPSHPHHIVIDMGKEYPLTGFRYLPRPEPHAPGLIKDYRIYLSQDGFNILE